MATKVHMCDECKHFVCNRVGIGSVEMSRIVADCTWSGVGTCGVGHKPRFYMPRNDDPYDDRCGYKRKCDDFESVEVC